MRHFLITRFCCLAVFTVRPSSIHTKTLQWILLTGVILGPYLGPGAVGPLVGQAVVGDKLVEGLIQLHLSSIGSPVALPGSGSGASPVLRLSLKVGHHLIGRGRGSSEGENTLLWLHVDKNNVYLLFDSDGNVPIAAPHHCHDSPTVELDVCVQSEVPRHGLRGVLKGHRMERDSWVSGAGGGGGGWGWG